jgi:hypothetical protein
LTDAPLTDLRLWVPPTPSQGAFVPKCLRPRWWLPRRPRLPAGWSATADSWEAAMSPWPTCRASAAREGSYHGGHDGGPREGPPGPAHRRTDPEPDAFAPLLDPEGDIHRRVDEAVAGSFHPRAYLCRHPDGTGTADVGSSDLSATALGAGLAWNYRIVSSASLSHGYRASATPPRRKNATSSTLAVETGQPRPSR